jgi:hypothetical protein
MFRVDPQTLGKICAEEKECVGQVSANIHKHHDHHECHEHCEKDHKQFYMNPSDKQHGVNASDHSLRRVKSENELHKILHENSHKKPNHSRPEFKDILYLDSHGNVPVTADITQKQNQEAVNIENDGKTNISNQQMHKRSKPKKLTQEQLIHIDPNVNSPLLQ